MAYGRFTMAITVEEIPDTKLSAFINYPYSLFRKHPFWVGELKKDTHHLLGSGHPFWRHSERKLFMAFNTSAGGTKPAGRIAAIINSQHNSFHEEKCGFFGFFDCVNNPEAAAALFGAACNWLKEKGMDIARGPVNPSTNETCGMLLEGFDSPPMVRMPYNPPYYLKLTEEAGFAKAKDLYAFKCMTADGFPQRLEKIADRAMRGLNISIELIDMKNFKRVAAEFKDIYNSAWKKNWSFVPMTDAELDDMAGSLRPVLKPDYLFFARVDGKPAGAALLLPDLNIPLAAAHGALNLFNILPFLWKKKFSMNRGRMLTLGVKKEFRNRGLEILLIKQGLAAAKKMGWEYGEVSWTLEDNDKINNPIKAMGATIYKKYRIYEKKL
ncbi:MAG TPA: hypothetical protein DER10_00050 [Elusimicrobia bacterium]|nr:hypothetical protein [Elusimicrobiota bacterium]